MALTVMHSRRKVTIIPDGSADINVATLQGNHLPMGTVTGNYTVGETVTQAVSGATGVVGQWKNGNLYLSSQTGTFNTTNIVTGGSSGATGIPSAVGYAFPNGIRLSSVDFFASDTADVLVVRERVATGPEVCRRRDTGSSGVHSNVGGRSWRVKPYIANGDCTFTTPANVRIILEYD